MFKLQETPGVYAPVNVAPVVGTPNDSLVSVVTNFSNVVETKEVEATVVETPKAVENVKKDEVKIELKRVSKKKPAVVEKTAE